MATISLDVTIKCGIKCWLKVLGW